MKIVILDSLTVSTNDINLNNFNKLGDIKVYKNTTIDNVINHIDDAEVVFCTKAPITAKVFENCKNLKYIGLFSTGYNNVDIQAASEHNVIVCNVPEYSTNSVAQHVFAFILHHYSKISEYANSVDKGDWINTEIFTYYNIPISDISNFTLGIIGFGSIGKRVSEIAIAFGIKVIAYTRTSSKNVENIDFVSLDELLKQSDIVTIHCPLNEQTKELINSNTLSKMKKSAFLINTARGGIINENDLAFALKNGIISAAGLDVLTIEPMLENNPLRNINNCYITPHVAWSPKTIRENLINLTIENFIAWENNKPINVVNKEVKPHE